MVHSHLCGVTVHINLSGMMDQNQLNCRVTDYTYCIMGVMDRTPFRGVTDHKHLSGMATKVRTC